MDSWVAIWISSRYTTSDVSLTLLGDFECCDSTTFNIRDLNVVTTYDIQSFDYVKVVVDVVLYKKKTTICWIFVQQWNIFRYIMFFKIVFICYFHSFKNIYILIVWSEWAKQVDTRVTFMSILNVQRTSWHKVNTNSCHELKTNIWKAQRQGAASWIIQQTFQFNIILYWKSFLQVFVFPRE